MNEVLDNNFDKLYPKIEDAIKAANFITIDAEFTGIFSEDDVKLSYFDSINDRYSILKKNIERFAIVQFGIGVFNHERNNDVYQAQCFNFYLFPRAGSLKNVQLSWQVSSLEFLSKYKFDFNKFVNNGISYLNEEDELTLRSQINCSNFSQNMACLGYDDELYLKACLDKVFSWIANNRGEVTLTLEARTPILQYMLHKAIRKDIKNVWTVSGYKSVNIIRVTKDVRGFLQSKESDCMEEELIQSYKGFSTVFKLLVSCKKPIIGHNVFLDLMFMHQQFYRSLPGDYEKFKSDIHNLFPQIYDTKYLSFKLQDLLNGKAQWGSTTLPTLYEYFTSEEGQHLVLSSPTVHLNLKGAALEESYHNAAWDSYITGYIFIKMAYMFGVKKFALDPAERHITNTELMSAVKEFTNCINITRSNKLYLQLDGQDPTVPKLEWLHVKLNSPLVDTKQLANRLSSFCSVDLKQLSHRQFLVAVSSRKSALQILKRFQSNSDFQVTRYNRLRHAPLRNVCLWSGLAVTGSCLVALIMRNVFLKLDT